MKHTLSVTVENKSGVLTRIAGLFARRGYNIDSLAVGETDVEGISRITIVVDGDERIIEQVSKQLYKLIEVIKLVDLTKTEYVNRELMLMKVKVTPETRAEILQTIQVFRAKVVDLAKESLMIEAVGDNNKMAALQEIMRGYGILEIVRTGAVAMARGNK